MMHMTFYWGITATILFDSWKTTTWLGYALSLLACFIVSAFYQYMEDRRIRIKTLSKVKASEPSIGTPLLTRISGKKNTARFATSVLFGINSAIGYCLMLAVMSFNGGVFIAIVLGLSVGYFLFRTGEEDVDSLDNACACA